MTASVQLEKELLALSLKGLVYKAWYLHLLYKLSELDCWISLMKLISTFVFQRKFSLG
jgi:hypothetical protein